MYRYNNGQISLADFKQPVGMNLRQYRTEKRAKKKSHNPPSVIK